MSQELKMLIGLPGSGKSTWREKFFASMTSDQRDSWLIACTDDMIDRWAEERGLTYDQAWGKAPMKDFDRSYYGIIKEAASKNKNVLVDRTNMGFKARNKVLQLVPNHRKVAVVFVVPDNVLEQRLSDRALATGKTIPAFVLKNMISRYDAPTKNEFDEIQYVRYNV